MTDIESVLSYLTEDDTGEEVEDEDDEEEDKGGEHQSRLVEREGEHLAVVVGDEGRDRVAGVEETAGSYSKVAADHEDSDSLAEGTADGEDDGGDKTRERLTEYDVLDSLPAGSTEGEGSLAEVLGNIGEEFDKETDEERDSHDAKDDATGEDSIAARGARERRSDELRNPRDNQQSPPYAVDDRGKTGENIEQRKYVAPQPGAGVLRQEHSHQERDREGEGDGEDSHPGSPHDKGEEAELVLHRLPLGGRDETPERVVGEDRSRLKVQPDSHRDDQQKTEGGEDKHQVSCNFIFQVTVVHIEKQCRLNRSRENNHSLIRARLASSLSWLMPI